MVYELKGSFTVPLYDPATETTTDKEYKDVVGNIEWSSVLDSLMGNEDLVASPLTNVDAAVSLYQNSEQVYRIPVYEVGPFTSVGDAELALLTAASALLAASSTLVPVKVSTT